MAIQDHLDSPFAQAARILGQAGLARITGKHQTTVRERLVKGLPLWPESVFAVEAATGISRHDLRPDIYPRDVQNSPHEAANSDQTGAA